jgi:tetratricopeptide (TPR) repeat protein
MNYGLTRAAAERIEAFDYLQKAAAVTAHDPVIEINLAHSYEHVSRSTEAEGQFRHAMGDAPFYSPAYSSYAQWLLNRSRAPEALTIASKAVALDAYDLAGRRTLMDIMAQRHEWAKLTQFANETLHLLPYDPDAQRSLQVAQTGLDQVVKAETVAKSEPSVNNYLALSVQYFQVQRYQDCIDAARKALKVNPNQAEAYANIAAAYHTLGNLDETIAALQEEVRLNPNLPSGKSNLEVELAAKKARSGH